MSKVACVIPAAGYGSLYSTRSNSKVVEDLHGENMICRVVRLVKESGAVDQKIVVVVNGSEYGEQVRDSLSAAGYHDLQFAVQFERRGTANAVEQAMPELHDVKHVLVTFGDMALWRPLTFSRLVDMHLSDEENMVSMVTIRCNIPDYGRIMRDKNGKILAAVEPHEINGFDLTATEYVNPSLYVFNRQWLQVQLPKVPLTDKGDGFAKEAKLERLVWMASGENLRIAELEIEDPEEALGVNTEDQLREVQAIIARRNGNS